MTEKFCVSFVCRFSETHETHETDETHETHFLLIKNKKPKIIEDIFSSTRKGSQVQILYLPQNN